MTAAESLWDKIRHGLEPVVYLSNNLLSLAGVVLTTTSAVFWLFLLPSTLQHEVDNPYTGILTFLMLPAVFFGGLILMPLGLVWNRRRQRRQGRYPEKLPALDVHNPKLRRLVLFIGVTTAVNLVLGSQFTYNAVDYMDGVTFCGKTCHTVMEPEFTAYQNSPHSRVECVKCHIGPGASWFVKSKLSGVGQVIAVTFNTYDRPIPTPVRNLRPARETCEVCHWPQKFGEDRLRVVQKFADDEKNKLTKSVLLMRIGGGRGGPGIHGTHLGRGVVIRYAHADEKRQTIPWVEYNDGRGRVTAYTTAGAKPEAIRNLPVRTMDCMDCHNRPTHAYELPERAVDKLMSSDAALTALPFFKKRAVELLKKSYASREEAQSALPAAIGGYYGKSAEAARASQGLLSIYNRNIFPAMKVAWGTYPNNLGHTDFPGCYRCHDDAHAASGDRKITQDCNACHRLLAMEEAAPKILVDLGLAEAPPAPAK
jgi:hypothetical protein